VIPYHQTPDSTLYHGDVLDVLKSLPSELVQTIVTSPPYWGLRDYGVEGQLGLETTPEEYTARMVEIFREARRVLRADGTLWLNLGDSYGAIGGDTHSGFNMRYTGLRPKNLIGIPWRVAFALQADGWYLRSDIIWSKPNPMPESVTDRPTKAHEYIFLMSKSEKYYYDQEAVKEDSKTDPNSKASMMFGSTKGKNNTSEKAHSNNVGKKWEINTKRNRRTIWEVATQPFKAAHFAVFPPKLIEPCVLAGAPEDGIVLDPFNGSGTTGRVCKRLKRQYIGIDINAEYLDMTIEHEDKQEALL